jgi:hypothetical protein
MLTEKLREIYALVGELSTRVSNVETCWYLLFTCLMHQTPRELVDAIINLRPTGEAQRQIIVAVIATLYPEKSEPRIFLGQLKLKTDELTGRRNAAIHSIISIVNWTVPPRIIASGTSKRSKQADKDIATELKDCLKLAEQVAAAILSFMDALDVVRKPSPALVCPQLKAGWTNPLAGIPVK